MNVCEGLCPPGAGVAAAVDPGQGRVMSASRTLQLQGQSQGNVLGTGKKALSCKFEVFLSVGRALSSCQGVPAAPVPILGSAFGLEGSLKIISFQP